MSKDERNKGKGKGNGKMKPSHIGSEAAKLIINNELDYYIYVARTRLSDYGLGAYVEKYPKASHIDCSLSIPKEINEFLLNTTKSLSSKGTVLFIRNGNNRIYISPRVPPIPFSQFPDNSNPDKEHLHNVIAYFNDYAKRTAKSNKRETEIGKAMEIVLSSCELLLDFPRYKESLCQKDVYGVSLLMCRLERHSFRLSLGPDYLALIEKGFRKTMGDVMGGTSKGISKDNIRKWQASADLIFKKQKEDGRKYNAALAAKEICRMIKGSELNAELASERLIRKSIKKPLGKFAKYRNTEYGKCLIAARRSMKSKE